MYIYINILWDGIQGIVYLYCLEFEFMEQILNISEESEWMNLLLI